MRNPHPTNHGKLNRISFMIRIGCILALLVLLSSCSLLQASSMPKAQNGVLDLSHWDLAQNGTVRLHGQWELYWGRLLEPANFNDKETPPVPTGFINIPHSWTGITLGNQTLPADGFATFRLRIQTNRPGESLALKLPYILTSYNLWVNGTLLATSGKVAIMADDAVPQFNTGVVAFTPESQNIELLLQVSNFHHSDGGITQSILLGTAAEITSYAEKKLAFEMMVIGSLLLMGLYHLGLFSMRPNDKLPFYFGLFCLILSIRSLFVGEIFITKWFPNFNYDVEMIVKYGALYLAVPVFTAYLHHLYPQEISRITCRVTTAIAGLALVFALLTSARIFSLTLKAYEIYIVAVIAYLLYRLFQACRHRQEAARLIIAATAFFFVTVINDFLFYNGTIHTGEYTAFGLFVFTFAQAFLLSRRFAYAYATVENMAQKLTLANEELARLNANLENIVQVRTQQLADSKEQLQQAYDDLRHMEMSRRHLLANFSHDLRTPITLIQGYSEALMDGLATGEKQDRFLRQIYNKAVQVGQIIQDLFLLSQLEARELPFERSPVRLSTLLQHIHDQFESDVKHAGIHFVVNHPGAGDVELDIDLRRIEQVFSNLIYNAIRHTPAEGKIEISGEVITAEAKHGKQDEGASGIFQAAMHETAAAGAHTATRQKHSTMDSKPEVLIRVSDTGSGIPSEMLPSIFERLYKVPQPTAKTEGSGLGLSICKEIVETHGGRIWVSSQPGHGSTFFFTLPIYLQEETPDGSQGHEGGHNIKKN